MTCNGLCKQLKRIGILFILFAFVSAEPAKPAQHDVANRSMSRSPHDRTAACDGCHMNEPRRVNSQERPVLLVADISALCYRCHEIDPFMSHPSGIPVSRALSEPFHLGGKHELTCVTCHYTHRENRPDTTGYMLRTEQKGRRLCNMCHGGGNSAGSAEKHSAIFDRAHLRISGQHSETAHAPDEAMYECLGCHDDVIARSSSVRFPDPGTTQICGSALSSHPVGVIYPSHGPKAANYRPSELLDSRLRLFDRKLECSTCHSFYSTEDKKLVMSNERSRLCLACHLM